MILDRKKKIWYSHKKRSHGDEKMELWDIYDENRNKTGRLHERGKPLSNGEYHLVVHIWVRDKNGRFLITKRSLDKPFGGCWECTGGSALAGENSLEAALRETFEETGLDHTKAKKTCMISYRRDDWFGDVWLFDADFSLQDVKLQKGETIDKRFADQEEIRQMKASGAFCNYDYIDSFLDML